MAMTVVMYIYLLTYVTLLCCYVNLYKHFITCTYIFLLISSEKKQKKTSHGLSGLLCVIDKLIFYTILLLTTY